jgi:hypothetical protein
MFSIGTVNEVTLAIGASVPTTNDEPVVVCGVVVVVDTVDPLPQPAINNAAAASETIVMDTQFSCVLKFMLDASHSQLFL